MLLGPLAPRGIGCPGLVHALLFVRLAPPNARHRHEAVRGQGKGGRAVERAEFALLDGKRAATFEAHARNGIVPHRSLRRSCTMAATPRSEKTRQRRASAGNRRTAGSNAAPPDLPAS